jgi:multidrug resistance efflux pump
LPSGRDGIIVLMTVLTAALTSVVLIKVDVPVDDTWIAVPDPGFVPLIATTTGTILRIHVRHGSLVSQGDTILELESRDLTLKRQTLESRIHQRETSGNGQKELFDLYRQLEEFQLELNSRTLVSPVDGHVIWLGSYQPGDILRPGTAVATIALHQTLLIAQSKHRRARWPRADRWSGRP